MLSLAVILQGSPLKITIPNITLYLLCYLPLEIHLVIWQLILLLRVIEIHGSRNLSMSAPTQASHSQPRIPSISAYSFVIEPFPRSSEF